MGGPLSMPGWRIPALAVLCVSGAAVYFIAGSMVGAYSVSELRGALRRQR